MKVLPPATFESVKDSFVTSPKTRSRRFPCKVMYMGIVGPPVEGLSDGKVMMKRVSRLVTTKKQSYNQHFVSNYVTNNNLKQGHWKTLFPNIEDVTIGDFIDIIKETYQFDEEKGNNLLFTYHSYYLTKKKKLKKKKLLKLVSDDGLLIKNRKITVLDDNGELVQRQLSLKDLNLRVTIPAKSQVHQDVTCNSQFMLDSIYEIGTSIRKTYSFLNKETPVYLFVDNAGGHGKKIVKEQYRKILLDKFNVHLEWQVANSPETNMLDLGVWMAIQSRVEYIHKRKVMQHDDLAISIDTAFDEFPSNTLTKVHDRWKLVLKLILAGKGKNDLVEKCRGLKVDLDDLPSVPDSDDEEAVKAMIKGAEDDSECVTPDDEVVFRES